MPLLERISRNTQLKAWEGEFPVQYLYTFGVAGERFFREIKENAKIWGVRCPQCQITVVPPSLYCERCFERLEEWVEVGHQGEIHTYTICYREMDGFPKDSPTILALIKISGVEGGLVHRVGEVDLKDIKIGMKVEAVFKPKAQRKGSILDILYFRPAQK